MDNSDSGDSISTAILLLINLWKPDVALTPAVRDAELQRCLPLNINIFFFLQSVLPVNLIYVYFCTAESSVPICSMQL